MIIVLVGVSTTLVSKIIAGWAFFRSSHPQMFLGKGVLKICTTYFWNLTLACVFSCEFAAYFQNAFFQEHIWVAASVVYWKFAFFYTKIEKVTNAVRKKYLDFILASLQGCITVDSHTSAEIFYFFKCIINTNSWKLNVHPLVRWVIAMIHGYLSVINLKIAFSTRWDIFSAKRLTSSSSGIFRFLTRLKMAAKAEKVELTEAFIMLGEEKNVTGI